MSETVELHGMDFSVYVRIARLALAEKGVEYRLVPLNPFAEDPPDPNRGLHPFGKMPVFFHGGARIIETQAIVRYIDEVFPGPGLLPANVMERARQNQIIGICDSYLYRALVWGVFVEILRKPAEGGETDPAVVSAALDAVDTAFSVIDDILSDGAADSVTLAEIYLAPMLDYGLRVEAAAALAAERPKLRRLWTKMRARPSIIATEPREFTALLPAHTLP